MRQIKFETWGHQQVLVTLFSDGTVEVEQRPPGFTSDSIWRPIREVEVIEIREEGDL